jgi:hypothetical protein
VWPIRERGAAYDADTFLDVIEALHDLIAKPLDGGITTLVDAACTGIPSTAAPGG